MIAGKGERASASSLLWRRETMNGLGWVRGERGKRMWNERLAGKNGFVSKFLFEAAGGGAQSMVGR
jgi:hypothetical protein